MANTVDFFEIRYSYRQQLECQHILYVVCYYNIKDASFKKLTLVSFINIIICVHENYYF